MGWSVVQAGCTAAQGRPAELRECCAKLGLSCSAAQSFPTAEQLSWSSVEVSWSSAQVTCSAVQSGCADPASTCTGLRELPKPAQLVPRSVQLSYATVQLTCTSAQSVQKPRAPGQKKSLDTATRKR